MKRKVWTSTPYFLIFAIVLAAGAAVLYMYNPLLGGIEAFCAAMAVVIFVFSRRRLKRYIDRTVAGVISSISGINTTYLERFKMPVAVAGEVGDIVWSNLRFKKQLCQGRNPINENISVYLGSKNVDEAADTEGFEFDFDGRHYTVFCTSVDGGYICFYFDNTYYKDIAKKFNDTRKSVAIIVFDNREEFTNDSEEESARVILALETKLLHFAGENNALFKSLPSNRYMMIFDKSRLDKLIADKFPILKDVRSITYNNREATISVGIGMNCDTLIDSENCARKALDMALGRGGDQVAVMRDGEYEFIGGISAGIERMSKVRTRVVSTSISRVISESDRVFVMGHRFSDLDCLGAAVGLQPMIRDSFKKYCRVVINKETSMASALINAVDTSPEPMFITPEEALKSVTQKTLLIIVDTHIPDYVESPELLEKCSRVVVIDHHRKMVNYIDDAIIFYHEPTASSASEMVSELLTYLGETHVSKMQAEALLAGIMLDTKNFVVRTGVRTFEAAAFLRRRGADTVATKTLFASGLETHKEKYRIVNSAEIVNSCAVAVTERICDNIRMVSAQAADELLSVEDVKASFVIFRTDENTVNISSRSYGKLNVQLVMEALGGGGHQNMAAVQIKNESVEQVKEQLFTALNNIYSEDGEAKQYNTK
ncbi:MAG: DHH family phosphoesterase [Ruminococcus sp.]|nr:DHH family phosphoesterase [Ruminococcus sp.]